MLNSKIADTTRKSLERKAASAFWRRGPVCTRKYRTLLDSTLGALKGFRDALRFEKKVRQVFLALLAAVSVCVFVGAGGPATLLVAFSWTVSLACELFNTALEKSLDYSCHNHYHPLVREGKDYASAATFISIVFAVLATLFVLGGASHG